MLAPVASAMVSTEMRWNPEMPVCVEYIMGVGEKEKRERGMGSMQGLRRRWTKRSNKPPPTTP